MKNINTMVIVGLMAVMGILLSSCASLNPNTEGHILDALDGKSDAFRQCYETVLDKNRDTKGLITLELNIDEESGAVTTAEVESSTISDPNMNRCVAKTASDITLPEPPGVPVEGHYDINFDFQ